MIWSGNETRRNMASFPPSQIYICHFNVSPYEGNLYHRYFCLGQTIYTLPTINKGKGREAKLSLWVERVVAVLLYMLKTYPHAVPM